MTYETSNVATETIGSSHSVNVDDENTKDIQFQSPNFARTFFVTFKWQPPANGSCDFLFCRFPYLDDAIGHNRDHDSLWT